MKLKKMRAWQLLTILLVAILLIASIICVRWYVLIYLPYVGYSDLLYSKTEVTAQPYDMGYEYIRGNINGFECEVHQPSFLSKSGFIAVRSGDMSVTVNEDETFSYPEEPYFSLFIWPSTVGKTTYGLMIIYDKEEVSEQSIIQYNITEGRVEIDHDFSDEKAIGLYKENEDTIREMIKCADDIWKFDGINDSVYGWQVKNAKR